MCVDTSGGLGQRPPYCTHPLQIALVWWLSPLSKLQRHWWECSQSWPFPMPKHTLAKHLWCKGFPTRQCRGSAGRSSWQAPAPTVLSGPCRKIIDTNLDDQRSHTPACKAGRSLSSIRGFLICPNWAWKRKLTVPSPYLVNLKRKKLGKKAKHFNHPCTQQETTTD
jgi:hypothetical protein